VSGSVWVRAPVRVREGRRALVVAREGRSNPLKRTRQPARGGLGGPRPEGWGCAAAPVERRGRGGREGADVRAGAAGGGVRCNLRTMC
jgi:hypothetical protein